MHKYSWFFSHPLNRENKIFTSSLSFYLNMNNNLHFILTYLCLPYAQWWLDRNTYLLLGTLLNVKGWKSMHQENKWLSCAVYTSSKRNWTLGNAASDEKLLQTKIWNYVFFFLLFPWCLMFGASGSAERLL